MFSDGNIAKATNHINISSNDKDLIEQCKKLLKTEAQIHHYKNSFSLIISNLKLHKDLEKWGVIPRKSWLDFSLPKISNKHIPHFIRGVYDGDGSFFKSKIAKGKYVYLCSSLTCGSKMFLDEMKKFLEKHLSINFNQIKLDNRGNGKGSYQLRLSNQNDMKTFTNFLYSNANYFLKRKKDIVNNFYYGQI